MRWLALLALLGCAAPAVAQESFDCGKAASATEKTICASTNYELAYRDGVLAKLFAAVKVVGGQEAVLSGQKAWLKARDACQDDVACIAARYDERIAELARAGGDDRGLTGTYRFKLADGSVGELWLVRDVDGSILGRINSVSGVIMHVCDLEFFSARGDGQRWEWLDTEEDSDGNHCKVRFEASGNAMSVASQNCSFYCGAHGGFDGTYERAK